MTLFEEENKELFAARNQAYRYLAIRDHFTSELLKKLLDKGHSSEICETLIDELKSENLINDYEAARKFAEIKLQTEGSHKVYMRIVNKGVSSDIARRAIEDVFVDEEEVCYNVLLKKYGSLAIEKDKLSDKDERKLVNFLKNRGFNSSAIYKSISKVKRG